MSAHGRKRARCAAMARRFMRPRCPECGKPGQHWVSGASGWVFANGAGGWAFPGFWTCPRLYGADGRRLSL